MAILFELQIVEVYYENQNYLTLKKILGSGFTPSYHNKISTLVSKIINTVKIPHKTLLIIPDKDKIVPKQSALSLANYLKHNAVLNIYEGHIGLMSFANAPTRSWNLISEMINRHL